MTALHLVAGVRAGKGRQPAAVEALRDARDEVLALEAEALALVEACLPLAHRLYFAAQVIGPEMSQTAIALIARLERHGRQNGRAA